MTIQTHASERFLAVDFHGGAGEEMFRGILSEKLGTEMAKRGGIGLAPAVLDQIIKLQQGQ